MTTILDPLSHLIVAVCLIAAYAALRWHGVDEPVLLGILGGQLGGVGLTAIAQKAASTPPPSSPVASQPAQTNSTNV